MNNIIIELCAEDRARLDRLAEALERKACDKCVSSTLGAFAQKQTDAPDPIQEKLAETLASVSDPTETPKNAAGEAEPSALPSTSKEEEKPVAKEGDLAEPVKPTITLEQIQQKVVQLAAGQGGAKKAKVREIINAYGAKVSYLKDQPDKWTEVWEKLAALESEE